MKKIYSLALALVAGLSVSAQTAVVNETTGTGYDDFKTAYNAAVENDVLVVNEDQTAGLRITGNVNRTIKGASQDIVLKWGDTSKPMILSDSRKTIVIENITIGNNGGNPSQDFIRSDKYSSSVVTLNNVIISDVTTTSANGLINAQTNAVVNINGVTVENCNLTVGFDMILNSTNNCTIAGVNKLTISMPGTTSITNKGVADGNDVTLVFDDARSHGSVVVKDCDNPALFKVAGSKFVLKAQDGNLVAMDRALVGVEPVINENTGKGYNALADAVAEAKESEVLVLNVDQTISSRFNISGDVAAGLTIKGAEGKNIKLIRATAANSLMILVNKNVTFENLTIDGADINASNCCVEVSNNTNKPVGTFKNVKFVNVKSTNNQGVLSSKNGGTLVLENVVAENCEVPEGRGEVFFGTNGSKVIGNIGVSMYIQSTYSVAAENITNEVPVRLFFDDNRGNRRVAISGYNDAAKFVAGQSFAEIVADGENLVAVIANADVTVAFAGAADVPVETVKLDGEDKSIVFNVPEGYEVYYRFTAKSEEEVAEQDLEGWTKYEGTPVVLSKAGTLEYKGVIGNAETAVKTVTVTGTSTSVVDVIADDENAPVEYFNLQGVRVENPAAGGLYIKRQGSKVTKVIL